MNSKQIRIYLNQTQEILSQVPREFLDAEEDPLKLDILEKSLKNGFKPDPVEKDIYDVLTLCLYYEDLLKNQKEAKRSQLIKDAELTIYNEVEHFCNYTKNLLSKSNEIKTLEDVREEIEQLSEKISELEDLLEI